MHGLCFQLNRWSNSEFLSSRIWFSPLTQYGKNGARHKTTYRDKPRSIHHMEYRILSVLIDWIPPSLLTANGVRDFQTRKLSLATKSQTYPRGQWQQKEKGGTIFLSIHPINNRCRSVAINRMRHHRLIVNGVIDSPSMATMECSPFTQERTMQTGGIWCNGDSHPFTKLTTTVCNLTVLSKSIIGATASYLLWGIPSDNGRQPS